MSSARIYWIGVVKITLFSMFPLSKLPLTPNLLLSINLHMSSLHSQSSQISLPYCKTFIAVQFSSVQSLSHFRLFATPWTTAHQVSLSITNSQSPPKTKSTGSMMPSTHLILCRPLLLLPTIFPSIRVFKVSQLFTSGGQSIGVSASTSVLPKNTQDWSPLGWTGWISLQSKGLSRVFSNTTVQKHQFFGTQLSS